MTCSFWFDGYHIDVNLGQIIGSYKQIYKCYDFMTTRSRCHQIEQVCSDHVDSGAYQVSLRYEKVTHLELILLEHNLVTVMIIINPFCTFVRLFHLVNFWEDSENWMEEFCCATVLACYWEKYTIFRTARYCDGALKKICFDIVTYFHCSTGYIPF